MSEIVHVEQDDYQQLCDGHRIRRGACWVEFQDGLCEGSGPQHVMINEQILAVLLLSGTHQVGNVVLDWDEGHGPGQLGPVAEKMRAQMEVT